VAVLIKFTINEYRKGKYKKESTNSNFNSKLSPYWRNMYYGMFRKW